MQPDSANREGDGARVLYADPDETARSAATAWLESAGYHAVSVADGLDALARVVEGRFRVVVLHAQLPRVDGYRACALIKRHPSCRRTPVIIMAVDADPYGTAEARVAGAERCLPIPLTEIGLLAAVRQSLEDMPLLIDAGRETAPGSEWMEGNVREP